MEQLDYSIFPERPVVYATFWTRFLAYLIDVVILAIVGFIADLAFGYGLRSIFLNFGISWLYYAIQESGSNMATIGKKAMNIKVTDLDGNRVTFGQATGRYFGKILSALILLMGYFMMLWDEKSQTLHDKMAGTLVVQQY